MLLEVEEDIKDFCISIPANKFQEDIYQFESPLKESLAADTLFKGIALSTHFNLKDKDYGYVLETIETLSENIEHLSDGAVLSI